MYIHLCTYLYICIGIYICTYLYVYIYTHIQRIAKKVTYCNQMHFMGKPTNATARRNAAKADTTHSHSLLGIPRLIA